MPYIVQSARAKMPSRTWGEYRRVAVLEVAPEYANGVAMISTHARGVVRIVKTWERLHAGGKNTAFARAKAEALTLATALNAGNAE